MKALLRNVMISPRKIGLVADLMKKLKTVSKCVQQLTFHPRRKPCKIMLKLLNSALANAKQKNFSTGNLVIDIINVGRGSANFERTWFRGRGKVDKKERYSSNVEIILKKSDHTSTKRGRILSAEELNASKNQDVIQTTEEKTSSVLESLEKEDQENGK